MVAHRVVHSDEWSRGSLLSVANGVFGTVLPTIPPWKPRLKSVEPHFISRYFSHVMALSNKSCAERTLIRKLYDLGV